MKPWRHKEPDALTGVGLKSWKETGLKASGPATAVLDMPFCWLAREMLSLG